MLMNNKKSIFLIHVPLFKKRDVNFSIWHNPITPCKIEDYFRVVFQNNLKF